MQISHERSDNVTVLSLNGRLDELATTEVEKAFMDCLHSEACGLIVDLSAVEYISSSGLRVLLMLAKAMKKQDRDLRLCRLSPFVAEVFEISNFTAMFNIYDDLEVARRSFDSGTDG